MADEDQALFAELEDMFAGLDVSDVEDLTQIESPELATMVHRLTQELIEEGQALRPTTQEARDKHSKRNAAQVELRKRGVAI